MALSKAEGEDIALNFIGVIQELTRRVGEDESATIRYIEAMQAIVQSEGPKSFVISSPSPKSGVLPVPPQPALPAKGKHGQESGTQSS